MTEQTQPTDAELMPCPFCGEAAKHSFNDFYGDMSMACCKSCGAQAYAPKWNRRAALAKWGTPPAVAGEPVAWYEYNADLDAWFLAYSHNPKAKTRPLVFGDTTPQPTQAQAGAVPLTDAQISNLWDGHTVPVFGKTGINPFVFARALESEVRKQDEALIRQLLEALESVDGAMPFPVARQVLKVARARLEGKPCA